MTERLLNNEIAEKCAIFDDNYKYVLSRIEEAAKKSGRNPKDVILLAATKTVPVEVINHAIESGLQFVGENRVQEFLSKDDALLPVHKHFIGHLQTNKVKDIVGKVELIESVHSLKLAKEISKHSQKLGIITDVLLEVNIGGEESKSGIEPELLEETASEIAKLEGIKIKGLMAIPPICEENDEIIEYFTKMHKLFVDIKGKNIDNSSIEYLSMGMSQDYEQAIMCGANIVRVGSLLFGARNYGTV